MHHNHHAPLTSSGVIIYSMASDQDKKYKVREAQFYHGEAWHDRFGGLPPKTIFRFPHPPNSCDECLGPKMMGGSGPPHMHFTKWNMLIPTSQNYDQDLRETTSWNRAVRRTQSMVFLSSVCSALAYDLADQLWTIEKSSRNNHHPRATFKVTGSSFNVSESQILQLPTDNKYVCRWTFNLERNMFMQRVRLLIWSLGWRHDKYPMKHGIPPV